MKCEVLVTAPVLKLLSGNFSFHSRKEKNPKNLVSRSCSKNKREKDPKDTQCQRVLDHNDVTSEKIVLGFLETPFFNSSRRWLWHRSLLKPYICNPQIPDISIQRWCILIAFLIVKWLHYPLYEETLLKEEKPSTFLLASTNSTNSQHSHEYFHCGLQHY